jgi:CO/xanthine dehydrogenase Mo-binding subunit
VTRPDARAKLHGETRYGVDLRADGMLWGALVPAPLPRGRIRRVELGEVRRLPGVVAAIGPDEAEALLPNGGGDVERRPFPREISYRGQPVAAVAAETFEAARAAVAKVRIEAEGEPPALELEALFPEWPIDPRSSPHVTAHVRAGHGGLAARFREADFVERTTFRTNGICQVALEPHACLAEVADGRWTVTSSTQTPFGVRDDLHEILGLPESQLVVRASWVGGGFGGKGSALLEPYALLLAAAAGRPVKLQLRYAEEFSLVRSTLPAIFHLETAVRDGRLTGRRVRMMLDTGASLPGRDFATGYAIGFLLGPYRYDAFEVEGVAVRTNKVPFGPHRAPLAPQCAFASESQIDLIARRLGVDPIEFRLRHVWREGDRTMFGQPVGPNALEEGLRRAAATRERWRSEGADRHGVGVAVGFWSTGTGAGGEARLRVFPDRLLLEEGEREIGSGSIVAGLARVVERVLGIPASDVELVYLDTASAPFDTGVFGSRTLAALGQAAQKAAEQLQRVLATRWGGGIDPSGVRLRRQDGELRVEAGGGGRPIRELLTDEERRGGLAVAGKHYGGGGSIDPSRVEVGEFYPYTDFAGSVHLAEVEVDRELGRVRVVRCAAFQDVGVAVDPELVRGQVEGAVAMGLGEALTEESLWGEDGRLLNAQLLDYRLPTLGEVPPIEVTLLEGRLGAGPFGAKGIGEPPIIPVPAAVANAVADATGVRPTELPMTPERVARALMGP